MKLRISILLIAALASLLAASGAYAQAVEVIVGEQAESESVQLEAAQVEAEAVQLEPADETPAAAQPEQTDETAAAALSAAESAEQGEAMPAISVAEAPDEFARPFTLDVWDGLYSPGEMAAIRVRDLQDAPWDYSLGRGGGPDKTWIHKWGLAEIDLVPFFTDGGMYAAKKVGIVRGVDFVTDEAGDWVSETTGMDFWSSENQERLERKFGFLAPLLSLF